MLALVTLVVVGLVSGSPARADSPVSQRDDEAMSILERIRLYRERHGIDGDLDSNQMLERTRWGYAKWLDTEHGRQDKAAAGEGWVSLGPSNGAGRMTALAPHPSIEGTLLAGAASGGVWKTTDAGLTWLPLTDGLSDLSVGAVAYAPSNPEVVYIGSGEAGLGSFFIPGIGLVRSSDGGETWFLSQQDEIVAEQFFALSVDPRDEDRVLAATERGLFSTADGGATWELRLGHPDLYGVTEILRSSSDPDRLWSALWCFSTCPDGLGRVMSSGDGGISWEPTVDGLPDALFNNPNVNRIALAVAPSDDRVLYTALNTSRYTPQGPEAAIYRSSDGGLTWVNTGDPGPYLIFQGWYDNAITIDPQDPNTVVAAGVWYVRSSDGGASWTTMDPIAGGDWMGTATLPHVDGHAFAWQDDTLWLGCDGGVWRSSDGGLTWDGRNESLVTRQYYGLDIDPIRPDRILGGTQDNKTNLRLGPGNEDWEWVLDGDGFECAINPLVPDLVYGTIYGTLVFRSYDGGFSWENISPGTGNDATPFMTPLTMQTDLPWTLFTGSSRVWRTTDAGSTWGFLGTEVVDGEWSTRVVRSVALTPADDLRFMIGKGLEVLTSLDGGDSWHVSPMDSIVNSVAISPFDADLAVVGQAKTAAGEPQLYRTTDGGVTWHGADLGLPPFAVQALHWHPLDSDLVFAGTDVGLYRSTDTGLSWAQVGDGLPAASVHDLKIAEDGSRIVVATHGRGIWELRLTEPVGESPSVTLEGPEFAVIGEPVVFFAAAVDPDGDGLTLRWVLSDPWQLTPGALGAGTVAASLPHRFSSGGEYLVAANAIDGTGRMGFDSMVVTVYEPGDDCSTPRVIPSDGPFPFTILTENRDATVGPEDPEVPCTIWPGDPNSGRWASIWLEFNPELDGTYTFSTCGSVPDTAISAWTGDACGPYEPVDGACNDDDRLRNCSGRDTDSWLSLDLVAGTTIRLMVGTTEDIEIGDLRITVDCPSCRPAPDHSSLLVAAAARTSGSQGSFWTSSLQVVNAGDAAATTSVELLPGAATAPAAASYELAPGATLTLDDVVGDLVGGRGSGALRLTSNRSMAATTRTATAGDEGSYGQGIPAVGDGVIAAHGAAVRLFGFPGDDAFRSNLGLVNPGADEISLIIRFYDFETNKLAEDHRTLAAGSWIQLNRVFEDFEIADETALVVVRQTSYEGIFSGYASVVDERTGDPTYLGPTGVGRVGDPLWIPAVAHTTGVGGVEWSTDLTICNPGSGDLITKVELLGPDGVLATTTVHVPDGWVRSFPDVVADTLDFDGAGALRITPTLGLVMATSRTYATTPDGSYGQGIPGVAEGEVFAAGELGYLPGLRQDESFRTNIGFANAGDGPVEVIVTAHEADGGSLGTSNHHVEGSSWVQLNQPLPEGTAYATVASTTPGAKYLAYASVVDRETDDPTYITAVRAAE
jgi:photosystem II stability/assembly factor-like uncharacterized protein